MRLLGLFVILSLLVTCGSPSSAPFVQPTSFVGANGQRVAQVQAQPPAAGASIRVNGWRGEGVACSAAECPEQFIDGCPTLGRAYVFTDFWLPSEFVLANVTWENLPLTELLQPPFPWLLIIPNSAIPEYRLQLQGHLGDPAYSHCPYADHIFVVEDVVERAPDQPLIGSRSDPALPPNIPQIERTDWKTWTDSTLGYAIQSPKDATLTALLPHDDVLGGISIVYATTPPISLTVQVYRDAVYRDPYDHNNSSPLFAQSGGTVDRYIQRPSAKNIQQRGPLLYGFFQSMQHPDHLDLHIWFEAGGHSYELATSVRYGPEVDQVALLQVSASIDSFQPTAPQSPTPTSAFRSTLGPGPFLDQTSAWEQTKTQLQAQLSKPTTFTLLEAALLPEATVRSLGQGECGTFYGHLPGLWVFRARLSPDDFGAPVVLITDATSGQYMCSTNLEPPEQATLPTSPATQKAAP